MDNAQLRNPPASSQPRLSVCPRAQVVPERRQTLWVASGPRTTFSGGLKMRTEADHSQVGTRIMAELKALTPFPVWKLQSTHSFYSDLLPNTHLELQTLISHGTLDKTWNTNQVIKGGNRFLILCTLHYETPCSNTGARQVSLSPEIPEDVITFSWESRSQLLKAGYSQQDHR